MSTPAVSRNLADHTARPLLAVAMLAVAASLGGCMTKTDTDTTGSIGVAALPASQVGLRDYAETWRRKHEADPADQTAAINYARALRASTQYAQAVAVLEDAAVKHPYSTPVLAAYGKALADTGRLREAMDVLGRAHTPDKPDWSVLSAQGSVADQLGDHAGALNYYDAALKIRPGEPSVMSNLGLSYALAKQLPQAEATLKTAAADPRADMRVRQNYALVLSLEGKFQMAEQVAATDLSAADAAESVSTIRQMIADSASWRGVQKADAARRAKSRKTTPPS